MRLPFLFHSTYSDDAEIGDFKEKLPFTVAKVKQSLVGSYRFAYKKMREVKPFPALASMKVFLSATTVRAQTWLCEDIRRSIYDMSKHSRHRKKNEFDALKFFAIFGNGTESMSRSSSRT